MSRFRRNATAAEFVFRFARLKGIAGGTVLSRFLDGRRTVRNEDVLFLADALLKERLAAAGFIADEEEPGFFARMIEWLSDPENRAKLEEIIKWFLELLEGLEPV